MPLTIDWAVAWCCSCGVMVTLRLCWCLVRLWEHMGSKTATRHEAAVECWGALDACIAMQRWQAGASAWRDGAMWLCATDGDVAGLAYERLLVHDEAPELHMSMPGLPGVVCCDVPGARQGYVLDQDRCIV